MSLKHGSYQNSIKHYIFLDIPHVLSSKNKKKKTLSFIISAIHTGEV